MHIEIFINTQCILPPKEYVSVNVKPVLYYFYVIKQVSHVHILQVYYVQTFDSILISSFKQQCCFVVVGQHSDYFFEAAVSHVKNEPSSSVNLLFLYIHADNV